MQLVGDDGISFFSAAMEIIGHCIFICTHRFNYTYIHDGDTNQ